MRASTLPAAGGAVCFGTIDCVSWGSFSGTTTPTSPGRPSPVAITGGMALRRTITGGCCTT